MVDPRIYDNPYRPPPKGVLAPDVARQNLHHAAAGLVPKGAVAEPMPSDGRLVKLVECLRCRMQKVPYVFAPRNRAYVSKCRGCGQPHVFHPKDMSMSHVQRAGAVEALGRRRLVKGTPTLDVKRSAFDDLRRKRELGPDYWRNPK